MITKQDHEKYTIAHFKLLAPIYGIVELFVGKVRRRVVEAAGTTPKKILDVACGPGPQSYQLALAGHKVIGIDLSPDMLERARNDASLDLNYIQQDATEMNFPDSEFDVSTISFALHDMPENLALDVLNEMRRVTKSGGQIIIIDYNKPSGLFTSMFAAISRLWETRYYWHFIKAGLNKYLQMAEMVDHSRKTYLFGRVQLVEIVNTK